MRSFIVDAGILAITYVLQECARYYNILHVFLTYIIIFLWLSTSYLQIRAEIAELFFVDTTPFVDAYFLNPQDQTYDWSGVSPRESYLQTILTVLENTYIYSL